MRPIAFLIVPALAAASASGQSVISQVNKFSWSENCGWMDWAAAGPQGAHIAPTFLSGSIWCENTGWISLGSGTPANGISYSNASGADAGVNIAPTGALSGFAWGENVGWVNFSGGAMALPAQPARFDTTAERFRGYAWGENIGWINLDAVTAGEFPKRACYANCDGSTGSPALNIADFGCFLNKFAAGDPYANCDRSAVVPVLTVADFGCFLNKFAAGCP